MSGEPELIVVADPAAASALAGERIATALAEAVAERGRADWVTTGGSAAIGIYLALAAEPLRHEVPWERVHVWWGDDRFVPRDHPLSNVKPLDDILLDSGEHAVGTGAGAVAAVPIPLDQLHPFRTAEVVGRGGDAAEAASEIQNELRAAGLPVEDGWPVFDLALLGVGPDGHLLSVFPGSAAFDSSAWALAIPAPTHVEPHVERVTLNPAILSVARRLLVVSHGAAKAEVLGTVFGPERDPRRWPAQLARRPGATWILDEAAAARLPR